MSSVISTELKARPHVFSERLRTICVATVEIDTILCAVWNTIANHVSPDEHEKAQRFVADIDRRTYLAAHSLKRSMLSWADPDVQPLAWRFEQGPHGKPAIEGGTDLHFNISHCHGLIACAVRFGRPVGIDVEWLGRPAPIEIARRFFSGAETIWLLRQPDSKRHEAFFRLWTLKEAYIKAVGLGLSQPLRDFTMSMETLDISFLKSDMGISRAWRFHQSSPSPDHILAVAWQEDMARETVGFIRIGLEAWLRPPCTGPMRLDDRVLTETC